MTSGSLQRISISEILEDDWFKKGYKPAHFREDEDVNLDDIDAVFNDSKVKFFLRCQFISLNQKFYVHMCKSYYRIHCIQL